ncbi:MAG: amidase [Gemmatimonadales bacterium]|nr:MAG: amidase [Gemmatimonadales bacterium]
MASEAAPPDGPQDARVDRRAFLHRMGALTAAAAAGVHWPPEPLSAGGPLPSSPAGVPVPDPPLSPGRAAAAEAFWADARRAASAGGALARPPGELTAWEAGVRIRDGSLRAADLVAACLERIRKLDAVYLAFNTVTEAEALATAAALDDALDRDRRESLPGGKAPGLLHGIPLALKDNVYTAGIRTTANAHMFRDFLPPFDATLLTRLRGAGSVLVGKTQMGPLATTRALTPDGEITTLNAWAPGDPRISPGGSSSGSATGVAARMVTTSVGTQTGGSITVPAASQGLTGLKPTMGRVSLRGVIPLTYTRDHPGPIARDARDAALMLQVMAGPDPADPRTLGLPPVPDYLTAAIPVPGSGQGDGAGEAMIRWPTRLGVPPEWAGAGGPQGERRRRFLASMEEGGVEVVEVPPPPGWAELSSGIFNAGRLPERSEPFLPWLREDVRLFGVTLSSWIQGLLLSGDEYVKAQRGRLALLRLALDHVFQQCDAVVQANHVPFDMIGLPLVTFPIGFREAGEGGGGFDGPLPEGVLVGAPPFGEERLLSLAALWQARSDHHLRRPPDPAAPDSGRTRAPGGRGRLGLEQVADLSQ